LYQVLVGRHLPPADVEPEIGRLPTPEGETRVTA
jgi:hypothetical protein